MRRSSWLATARNALSRGFPAATWFGLAPLGQSRLAIMAKGSYANNSDLSALVVAGTKG